MAELSRRLEQLGERLVEGARTAVRDETVEVRDDMRRGAPRDSGDLIRSIQAEIASGGLAGTAAATIRYATFVEHGTSDTPEQPFAGPAATRSRRRFPGRLREEIGGELKDLLR
jgi:HK97 gp10 family phage protein